ncbi:hypothetical protein N9850_08605 [Granulosicoccus sp.]|nr:hypothetical protein [Granulosicoccus sp.]MDB4223820.1 hypothetical protein [Granulosicoccus sp.]
MEYSEKLIILNSLNWAIIASSAIGAFGQFVENRHRDNHRKLNESVTKLSKVVYDSTGRVYDGEKVMVKNLVDHSKGLHRIKLRLPICGLFFMLFSICLINFIGICMVWARDSAFFVWFKNTALFSKIESLPAIDPIWVVFNNPLESYDLPLLIVSTALVLLCSYLSLLLFRVVIRQRLIAKAQIQVTDWTHTFDCRDLALRASPSHLKAGDVNPERASS